MMMGFRTCAKISVYKNKQELMISSGGMYLNCVKWGFFTSGIDGSMRQNRDDEDVRLLQSFQEP